MKKLMIGVLSLAFASCMTAAISMQTNGASAEEAQNTSIFTETKCQISKNGDRMLMVTGITDVSKVYEVGYDITGGYALGANDVAETDKYYESLTLGGVTKTAAEFLPGAQGLLIWEVDYNSTYTYSVQPYAYEGELNGSGQLIAPEVEVKSKGALKADFNTVTVKFADEDGVVLETKTVNIGATVAEYTAPEKADAEFEGWYVNGTEYDFDEKVTANMTITAKYKKAASYSVKVSAAQYDVVYKSGYYCPNALSYVDVTADYASYLGINADGIGKAMSGTEIDLTEAVKNLPAGVKVNNSSVLTGEVEEDGSMELSVMLDFDEDYLGFKISQVGIGDYSGADCTVSLALKNGVVGLAVDGTIGNGKGLVIDIDDVDKTVNPNLILTYYEMGNKGVKILALNDDYSVASTKDLLTTVNTDSLYDADAYYGAQVNLFDKFTEVTKISKVKIMVLGGGEKHMFVTGLKTVSEEKYPKTVVYSMDNGTLADKITPLAMGTMGEKASHHWNNLGYATKALTYHFAGTPINQYYRVGLNIDLGGAIKVSNYESIKIQFQTTAKKIADDTLNAGTLVYINGINATPGGDGKTSTYYNGCHSADLITLAKQMGIETITTVQLLHADWPDRYDINMYVGFIEKTLAAGVVVPEEPSDPAVSVTYSADNGNILDIATAIGNGALSTENNYEVGGVYYNNFCYRYSNVVSTPDQDADLHVAGVIFNLGKVNISGYSSIKTKLRVTAAKADGTNNANLFVWINGIKVTNLWGGPQEIDLKALAEANGITTIETLEISNGYYKDIANYNVFVSWIELVAAE